MNENIAKNIGKSVYTIIIFFLGFCLGGNIFGTRTIDSDYRAIYAEATAEYTKLEDRNRELETELSRIRAAVVDATANMERTIGAVAGDNAEALDAVRKLREIQRQIQDRLLDTRSDNGGVVGGGNILTES